MITNYNEALVRPFFDYFLAKGLNDNGICGLLGNMYVESHLYTNNLENSYEKPSKIGMTDEEYTKAVDNGTYTNFVHDHAGYGACQWTYPTRKEGLLNLAKKEHKSIADMMLQFDWLWDELSHGYKAVLKELCSLTNSVSSCARIVMLKLEKPQDQSEENQLKRVGYAQDFYDKYVEVKVYSRKVYMDWMRSFLGAEGTNEKHKEIIDIYNSYLPHPRGHKMVMSDDWCAATVSAAAIAANYTDICPIECSCTKLIELAQGMGIWQENDAYVPSEADWILYDWEDDGKGDCTGRPNHIGAVERINSNGTLTIIEGNYKGKCQKRSIAINGKYIRGYICPRYDSKPEPVRTYTVKPGDTLSAIARKYGVKWPDIAKANNITDPRKLKIGTVLIIP